VSEADALVSSAAFHNFVANKTYRLRGIFAVEVRSATQIPADLLRHFEVIVET
jgi:hypothetical protein